MKSCGQAVIIYLKAFRHLKYLYITLGIVIIKLKCDSKVSSPAIKAHVSINISSTLMNH